MLQERSVKWGNWFSLRGRREAHTTWCSSHIHLGFPLQRSQPSLSSRFHPRKWMFTLFIWWFLFAGGCSKALKPFQLQLNTLSGVALHICCIMYKWLRVKSGALINLDSFMPFACDLKPSFNTGLPNCCTTILNHTATQKRNQHPSQSNLDQSAWMCVT